MTEHCIQNCPNKIYDNANGYYYCMEDNEGYYLSVTIGTTIRKPNCKQKKEEKQTVEKTVIKRNCTQCKHQKNGKCYRFPPQPAIKQPTIKDHGIYGHPSYYTAWEYPNVEYETEACGEWNTI